MCVQNRVEEPIITLHFISLEEIIHIYYIYSIYSIYTMYTIYNIVPELDLQPLRLFKAEVKVPAPVL